MAIAAGCLAGVLAGCGGSSGGGPAAGPGPAAGSGPVAAPAGAANSCGSAEPGLCMTIEISGAVTVRGSLEVSMTGGAGLIESCAEYVKGEPGKSRLTLPVALGDKVDGHTIGIANRISKTYQGPRTYERKELGAIDGGLHVDVDQKSYQANDATTAQAEIAADGSGKLTFAGLREATNSSDTSPKGTISGSYTWTCHD
jgi:hypothetical protein